MDVPKYVASGVDAVADGRWYGFSGLQVLLLPNMTEPPESRALAPQVPAGCALLDGQVDRLALPVVALFETVVDAIWGDAVVGNTAGMPRLAALIDRVRELFGRLFCNRGRFVVRARVPKLLWAVVALHVAIFAVLLLYPYVVRSTRFDGWVLAVMMGIALHWVVFKGECVLSYVEKVLLYERYALGEAPFHHLFVDALPASVSVAAAALFLFMWFVSFWWIFLRNTLLSPWVLRGVRAVLLLLLTIDGPTDRLNSML
jgi:hypothetical protein